MMGQTFIGLRGSAQDPVQYRSIQGCRGTPCPESEKRFVIEGRNA